MRGYKPLSPIIIGEGGVLFYRYDQNKVHQMATIIISFCFSVLIIYLLVMMTTYIIYDCSKDIDKMIRSYLFNIVETRCCVLK